MLSNASARAKVRRIALLAIDRLDPDALCFALSACRRLEASLDVLTDLPSEEADRAILEMRSKADTPWRIIRIGGTSGGDVFRYVRDESGLLFVTSSDSDEEARRLRSGVGTDLLPPGISWVVVERRRMRGPVNLPRPIR